MTIQDELNIAIKFDLPVLPFFSLQDITDYGSQGITPSNVLGDFIITNPSGLVYSNSSWVTPDIALATTSFFNSVNIPLDNGVPLNGIYTFQYTINVFAGGVQQGIYTKTFSINYTYRSPQVTIDMENNPYVTLLSTRDSTQYVIDGITPTQARTFQLLFPSLSNFPNVINSLFYIAVTNPFYISGLYQSIVSSELNYTFLTYSVHDIVTGASQLLVEDTTDIQSIYCCLKKLNDTIITNPNDLISLGKFTRATGLLELLEKAIMFARYNDADSYIQQIYDVTGCSKGCTCGNLKGTTIQPYWQNVSQPSLPSNSDEWRVGDIKATFRTDAQSNWEYLDNQLFLITAYQDYYNIVGTMFNNGSEPLGYFRNEDGRSRGIIGAGQGVGLTNRVLGQKYGAESSSVVFPTFSAGTPASLTGYVAPSSTGGSFPTFSAGTYPTLNAGAFQTLTGYVAPSSSGGAFSTFNAGTPNSLIGGALPSLNAGTLPSSTGGSFPTFSAGTPNSLSFSAGTPNSLSFSAGTPATWTVSGLAGGAGDIVLSLSVITHTFGEGPTTAIVPPLTGTVNAANIAAKLIMNNSGYVAPTSSLSGYVAPTSSLRGYIAPTSTGGAFPTFSAGSFPTLNAGAFQTLSGYVAPTSTGGSFPTFSAGTPNSLTGGTLPSLNSGTLPTSTGGAFPIFSAGTPASLTGYVAPSSTGGTNTFSIIPPMFAANWAVKVR